MSTVFNMLAQGSIQRSQRRILLVEDNPGDALLVHLTIREWDPQTELLVVSDGESIVEVLEHYRPCLVLLDLHLPTKSGLDVLFEIRSNPSGSMIPVIVFTGSEVAEDVSRCYRNGANGFVRKPNSLARFGAVISQTVDYWLRTVQLPADGV